MKKIQLPKRKKQQISEEKPERITNETVAEHREKILAGGRRFKYPHQLARHKLVVNAIVVSVATLLLLVVFGWWQLYVAQNSSTFFYRVTRIVPAPVASVDGKQVMFSDYLMSLNGSKHYLEQSERVNLSSEDGKRQLEFLKSKALEGAIADAYAAKLAKENDISVSAAQVDQVINASLDTVSGTISKEVYDDSTYTTLGYTPEEYRHIIERSLLRQEVSYAIDDKALAIREAAQKFLKQDQGLALSKLAAKLEAKGYSIQAGSSGFVPKTNHDGGLTQAALKLSPGNKSSFFRSTTGDGYYLVQLTDKTRNQVSYNFLRIPLTQFDEQLKNLEKNGKINRYIDVAPVDLNAKQ